MTTTITRQWFRNDTPTSAGATPISGATGSSYIPTLADIDKYIIFGNQATNTAGSVWAYSVAAGPVAEAPAGMVEIAQDDANGRWYVTNSSLFPGATWSWEILGSGVIVGETGTYLVYEEDNAGVFVRAIANSDTATASLWNIRPVILGGLTEDFTATDGTSIISWNGWSDRRYIDFSPWPGWAPTPDFFGIRSGALVTVTSDYAAVWKNFTSSQDYEVTFHDIFDMSRPVTPTNSQRTNRYFFIDVTPAATASDARYIFINPASDNLGIEVRTASGQTGLVAINGVFQAISGVQADLTVRRSNNRIYLYVNGVEIPASAAAGGYDVSGVPATGNVGVSMFHGPTSDVDDTRLTTEISARALMPEAFTITSRTLIEPSVTYPNGAVELEGTCADFVTAFDWAIAYPNGNQIYNWSSSTNPISPGEWSVIVPFIDGIEGSANNFFYARPTGAPENVTQVPLGQIPVLNVIEPFTIGMNTNEISAYSPSDITRDRGRTISWRYRGDPGKYPPIPNSEKTADWWPNTAPENSHVTGEGTLTAIVGIVWEDYLEGIRTGTWTLTTNVACTMTKQYGEATLSNIAPTSCTITQSANQMLAIAFTGFTMPAEGLQVSITLDGEIALPEDLVTPQTASVWNSSNFGGEFTWRDMKATGAEVCDNIPRRGLFEGGPEFGASFCRQANCNYWHTFPWSNVLFDTEGCRDWVTTFRDSAPAGTKLRVEDSNEDWNWGTYQLKWNYMMAEAISQGLYNEVTAPPPSTPVIPRFQYDGYSEQGIDYGTNTTTVVIPDGEWFVCRVNEYRVFKTLATAPIGTAVPTTGSNAFFEFQGTFADAMPGVRRLQTRCQKIIGQILRDEMPENGISVLGVWQLDNPDFVADLLLFENAWEVIDEYAPTFYIGGRPSWNDHAWIRDHETDWETFAENIFEMLYDDMDIVIPRLVDMKVGVRSRLLAAGVPASRLPKISQYEGQIHFTIKDIPEVPAVREAMLVSMNRVKRDPRMGTLVETLYERMTNEVGGVSVAFMDVSLAWFMGPTEVANFGVREYALNGPWNDDGDTEYGYNAMVDHFS